jgi:hypothetical protein
MPTNKLGEYLLQTRRKKRPHKKADPALQPPATLAKPAL